MGWGLGDILGTVATGGAYGLVKVASDANKSKNDDANASAANNLSIYNSNTMAQAKADAEKKKSDYYGNSLSSLGGETDNYVSKLQGNLDKNVANADLYNQNAGRERAIANAKAGLSGVDTSAANEQSRRNAQFGAAAINEDAKRSALDMYGQSISNRIEGANQIDNSQAALAIAQMKQPETQYNPGLISSIFSGFF